MSYDMAKHFVMAMSKAFHTAGFRIHLKEPWDWDILAELESVDDQLFRVQCASSLGPIIHDEAAFSILCSVWTVVEDTATSHPTYDLETLSTDQITGWVGALAASSGIIGPPERVRHSPALVELTAFPHVQAYAWAHHWTPGKSPCAIQFDVAEPDDPVSDLIEVRFRRPFDSALGRLWSPDRGYFTSQPLVDEVEMMAHDRLQRLEKQLWQQTFTGGAPL